VLPKSVLVVDDNKEVLDVVSRLLSRHGIDVTTTSTSLGLAATVVRLQPDVVVLDVTMPTEDGTSLPEMVRRSSDVAIVLYTSLAERHARDVAQRVGHCNYVSKAQGAQGLYEAVSGLFESPDMVATMVPSSSMHPDTVPDEIPTMPPPPMSLERVLEEVESVRPEKKQDD
jgi:CheY-like chemotaxis protein